MGQVRCGKSLRYSAILCLNVPKELPRGHKDIGNLLEVKGVGRTQLAGSEEPVRPVRQ